MARTRVDIVVVLDARWPRELHWVDRTNVGIGDGSSGERPLRVARPRCAHDVVVKLLLAFVGRSVNVIRTAELRFESRLEELWSVNFFEVDICVV